MAIKKYRWAFGAAGEFGSSDETSGRIKIGLVLGKVSAKVRFKNHNASPSLNRVKKNRKKENSYVEKKKNKNATRNVRFLLIRVVKHRLLSALPFLPKLTVCFQKRDKSFKHKTEPRVIFPGYSLMFHSFLPSWKKSFYYRSLSVHKHSRYRQPAAPSIDWSRTRFKTRTRTSRNYWTKAIFHGRTTMYLLYFTGNI